MKKNYKTLILQKKQKTERKSWLLLINASLYKEFETFWNLISRAFTAPCVPDCCIPSKNWEKYFQSIFMEQGQPFVNMANKMKSKLVTVHTRNQCQTKRLLTVFQSKNLIRFLARIIYPLNSLNKTQMGGALY